MAASLPITVLATQLGRNPASYAPNTSIQSLPLLVYRQAFAPGSSSALRKTLKSNGIAPQWEFGMYGFSHYHTVHEVLAILQGGAVLRFGGEGAAERLPADATGEVQMQRPVEVDVAAGDLVVVPAGVAHRHVKERDGFTMLGSYPEGQSWDMNNCKGEHEEKAASEKIGKAGTLAKDPLYGEDEESPVMKFWKK